tara:strand:+ start:945 stop:1463 length:519 start_codon:yes stop_codon:yes gene_type:complete
MKIILIIIFSYLIQFNIVNANTKIVFVDLDKIISTSIPGLSVINQLKKINSTNTLRFNNDAQKLKKKETKLISQKNIISETDFQSQVNKLKLEVKNYNTNRNKIINDFKKLRIDNTNKLLELINPILVNYSNKNSISVILRKKDLIIGKSELDITDEIINIINSDINKFKIQ